MLHRHSGNPLFYGANTISDQVCAFETSETPGSVDPCSTITTLGIFISPHMQSPNTISNILSKILEHSKSSA